MTEPPAAETKSAPAAGDASPPATAAAPPATATAETAAAAAAAPAAVSPSGEKTPWTGDPGFPIADNWMLVDPRWVRKGIPHWLHYALLTAWTLFIGYILFLYFFHTPREKGFHDHPPAGLPGHPPPPAPKEPAHPGD